MRTKKLRGARKHLSRVQSKARSLQLELGPGSWYDVWHYHPGLGVHRRRWYPPKPSFRRKYRKALVIAFEQILEQVAGMERPFQTWLLLDDDFDQDAVYFHMPPADSHSPFPVRREARWDVPLPVELEELLDPANVRVGISDYEGRSQVLVVPIGIGVPLY